MAKDLTFDNLFEFVAENNVAMIDFYANWCKPCQQFLKILPRVETALEGLAIVGKVEVDENPILKGAFEIKKVPTFIFFKNGTEVYRVEGEVMRQQAILEKVRELNAEK